MIYVYGNLYYYYYPDVCDEVSQAIGIELNHPTTQLHLPTATIYIYIFLCLSKTHLYLVFILCYQLPGEVGAESPQWLFVTIMLMVTYFYKQSHLLLNNYVIKYKILNKSIQYYGTEMVRERRIVCIFEPERLEIKELLNKT